MEQEKKVQLIQDFATAINKVSAENGSNTPDFILANYLMMCLENFDHIVKMHDDWYSVHLEPAKKMKVTVKQDNTIQLEEVFNSIVLKTKDGEEMAICMSRCYGLPFFKI